MGNKRQWRPFPEARQYARSLGLKNGREWARLQRPRDIPSNPYQVYHDNGWAGWGDWLGTGRVRHTSFMPFESARHIARSLGLRSKLQWLDWARSDQRPSDIPSDPTAVYKQDWLGWGDWLGTGRKRYGWAPGRKVAQRQTWLPFQAARLIARSQGLTGLGQWRKWSTSDRRPVNIPSNPNVVYKHKGWAGWANWLGTVPRSRVLVNCPDKQLENTLGVIVLGIADHLEEVESLQAFRFLVVGQITVRGDVSQYLFNIFIGNAQNYIATLSLRGDELVVHPGDPNCDNEADDRPRNGELAVNLNDPKSIDRVYDLVERLALHEVELAKESGWVHF